jgi:hypothetical protein
MVYGFNAEQRGFITSLLLFELHNYADKREREHSRRIYAHPSGDLSLMTSGINRFGHK